MRTTMRLVTLSRVLQLCDFCKNRTRFTLKDFVADCGISCRRAKEIIDHGEYMGLIRSHQGHYEPTLRCRDLRRSTKMRDSTGIHDILMSTPHYSELFDFLSGLREPVDIREIERTLTKMSELAFNTAAIDVLSDWMERLGVIQRNVFSGKLYIVDGDPTRFTKTFRRHYDGLDLRPRVGLRKRYVEIPRLREGICETLRISRDDFNTRLVRLYERNPGKIELAGAPITSASKKSRMKVKDSLFGEGQEQSCRVLSSRPHLEGVEVGSKRYMFVAYHGDELL